MTALTLSGGAGNDTIQMLDMTTGTLILGGAGADSIAVLTAGDGSINGGSGADTISYSAIGGVATAAAGLGTINGGAGADYIRLGLYTGATTAGESTALASALTASFGNVTVGSGDKLFFSGTGYTAANWNDNNQVAVLSAASTGQTSNTASGDISVREAGDDLIIGIASNRTTVVYVNIVDGADLLTTTIGGTATAGGNLVINASNMGFTIAGDTTNDGFTISFT